MKTFTRVFLAGLTLASFSLHGQSSKSFDPDYQKIEQHRIHQMNQSIDGNITKSRSVSCADTSWYPFKTNDEISDTTVPIYNAGVTSSHDYGIGQVYRNTSNLGLTGFSFWVALAPGRNFNNVSWTFDAKVFAVDTNNNVREEIVSKNVTVNANQAGEAIVNFDSKVNVNGNFMIAIQFPTSSTDTLPIISDFFKNYDEPQHLCKMLQESGEWWTISRDSLEGHFAKEGIPSSYLPPENADQTLMMFPIFNNTLEANYAHDASDLTNVTQGTTITFTEDVSAPNVGEKNVTVNYGVIAQKKTNFTWWIVDDSDTSIVATDDSSSNLSYTFDSLGTFLVDIWAEQITWRQIWTGEWEVCRDIHSETITVVKDSTNAIEEMNTSATLFTAYPNPAQDRVSINFDLENNEAITLSIYNISGELVYTSQNNLNAGNHKLIVNTSDFVNGTYYYAIKTNSTILNSQFIIQK